MADDVEYRPIPGWPADAYRVGSDCTPWERRPGRWCPLPTWRDHKTGGRLVELWHDGRRFTRAVERLHRAAFSPFPDRWADLIGPDASARRPRPAAEPGGPKFVPLPPPPESAPSPEPVDIAEDVPPDPDDDPDRPSPSYRRGSSHPRARLSEDQVIEARRLHAEGMIARELAARFHVGRVTMHYALVGRTWRDVPMPERRASLRGVKATGPRDRARDLHAAGRTVAEIAAELGIAERTVYRQLGRLGRRHGSAHGRAKLDEATVIEARRLHAEGASANALAARYGVCTHTLRLLLRGKTWSHVPMVQ